MAPKQPTPVEAAERDKLIAETAKLKAETRQALANAKVAELMAEREHDKRNRERAGDEYHHVYVFDSAVEDASVKKCIAQLSTWARQTPGCAIELQINSPGGSIFAGFALVDFIRDLRARNHQITTVAFGMAASMGGVVLQAGDTRLMGANSLMLIHEGSLGATGDFGKVEDRVKLMELMHERILALLTERSNVNKAFIKRNWQRKDWWLDADTALKHGFIDGIR